MKKENNNIAPPDIAIGYMANDALAGKGPLAASYQAWEDAEVQKNTPRTGTADISAIRAEVKARSGEWESNVNQAYANSQDTAQQDNQIKLNPQGIISTLMNGGGIMGVIGGIISEFKPVKDFMAGIASWLGSKIGHMFNKDTPSLSFAEAQAQIREQNNNNAAVNGMQSYIIDQGAFIGALNNSPVRIELDATFNPSTDEAKKIVDGLKGEGQIITSSDGKSFATQEALNVLDGIAPNVLAGRQESSWAANK